MEDRRGDGRARERVVVPELAYGKGNENLSFWESEGLFCLEHSIRDAT